MALAGTARGTGTNTTSATSFTLAPGGNFASGSWAVLALSVDNAGSSGTALATFTVTDTLGNTWTRQRTAVRDPGAANAGCEGAVFTTPQDGGTLTTGTTITVSFGATSVPVKVWTLTEVTHGGGGISYVNGSNGAGGASTTPTVTTGSITSGNIVFGFCFNEYGTAQTPTADTDTTNGNWSTMQTTEAGSTTSGQTIITQWKVVNATGTQTYNPTLGTSSDWITSWIELHEAVQTTKTFTYSGGGTPAFAAGLVLNIAKTFTGAATVGLSRAFSYARSFTYGGGGTPTLSRIHNYLMSFAYSGGGTVAQTITDFIANQVAGLKSMWPIFLGNIGSVAGNQNYTRDFSYSATVSYALTKQGAFTRLFSYNPATSISAARRGLYARTFSYVAAVTPSLTRLKALLKAFTYTGGTNVSFAWTKVYLRAFTIPVAATVNFLRTASFKRAFTYSGLGAVVVSRLKSLSKSITITAGVSVSLARQIAKSFGYTASGVSALVKDIFYGSIVYYRSFTFNAGVAVGLGRAIAVSKAVTVAATATRTASAIYLIARTWAVQPALQVSKRISKLMQVTVPVTVSRIRRVAKTIATITVAGTVTTLTAYGTSVTKAVTGAVTAGLQTLLIPFSAGSPFKAMRKWLYSYLNRR